MNPRVVLVRDGTGWHFWITSGISSGKFENPLYNFIYMDPYQILNLECSKVIERSESSDAM